MVSDNTIDGFCYENFEAIINRLEAQGLLPKVFSQNGSQRRYGTRASLSIDLTKRNWFDHEQKEGGLLKTLITRQTNLLAKDWLFSDGFPTYKKT